MTDGVWVSAIGLFFLRLTPVPSLLAPFADVCLATLLWGWTPLFQQPPESEFALAGVRKRTDLGCSPGDICCRLGEVDVRVTRDPETAELQYHLFDQELGTGAVGRARLTAEFQALMTQVPEPIGSEFEVNLVLDADIPVHQFVSIFSGCSIPARVGPLREPRREFCRTWLQESDTPTCAAIVPEPPVVVPDFLRIY